MTPNSWTLTYPSTHSEARRPGVRISVPFSDSLQIKPSVEDLRHAIAGITVYPPDQILVGIDERLDQLLFDEYQHYFLAIARQLEPFKSFYQSLLNKGLDIAQADELLHQWLDRFDPISRHHFFVCTEPVPSLDDSETLLPGLSGIEQLLGYSYPNPDDAGKPPTHIPSKDADAYLLSALALNFPNIGLNLADRFPADFLYKILEDAAYLSDPDKSKQDSATNLQPPPPPPDPEFERQKDAIALQLADCGIELPDNF